jgi:hypothetical protein
MPEGSEVPINQNDQISPEIKPPEKEFDLDKFQRLKKLGSDYYRTVANRTNSEKEGMLYQDQKKEISQNIDILDEAFDKDDLFEDALMIFNNFIALDPFTEGTIFHQTLFSMFSKKIERIKDKMKVSASGTRLECLNAIAKTSYNYETNEINKSNVLILESYQPELEENFKKSFPNFSMPYLSPLLAILDFGSETQSDRVKDLLLKSLSNSKTDPYFTTYCFQLANEFIVDGAVLRSNSKTNEIIQTIIQDYGLDWKEIKSVWFDNSKNSNNYGEEYGLAYILEDRMKRLNKMGWLEQKRPGAIKFYKDDWQDRGYRIRESLDFLLEDYDASMTEISAKQEMKQDMGFSEEEAEEILKWWTQTTEKRFQAIEANLKTIRAMEQKHPGITKVLMNEFGIRDFGRYPEEILIAQYEQRDNLDIPYGVVIYPYADWNNALYSQYDTFRRFFPKIDGKYALRIVECRSLLDIGKALLTLNKRYAPENTTNHLGQIEKNTLTRGHKITFALIGGHGSEGSITFGNNNPSAELNKADLLSGEGIKRISTLLEDDPTIILVSCLTGKEQGIGQTMSEVYKGKVIAPNEPTNLQDIDVQFDNLGKPIFSVEYRESEVSKTYSLGKPLK